MGRVNDKVFPEPVGDKANNDRPLWRRGKDRRWMGDGLWMEREDNDWIMGAGTPRDWKVVLEAGDKDPVTVLEDDSSSKSSEAADDEIGRMVCCWSGGFAAALVRFPNSFGIVYMAVFFGEGKGQGCFPACSLKKKG